MKVSLVKIFLYILLIFTRSKLSEAQIRRTSSSSDNVYTWGYINMLPYEGKFLNVTATKTTQQPTKDNCVLDCIDIDDCWSINAIEQPNGSSFQCQLLSTDKHRSSTNYVALTGSTHFAIPSECDWEGTCMNPRKKCIPDFSAGTYECVCPPGFDVNCLFKNLALGQKVSVSGGTQDPLVVNDGQYGVICQNAYITLYSYTIPNWVRIDFGEWKHVDFIEVHNRVGELFTQELLSDSKLYVYGETPEDNRRLCAEIGYGGDKVYNLLCRNRPLYGRGVELYHSPDSSYTFLYRTSFFAPSSSIRVLQICEIVILGY